MDGFRFDLASILTRDSSGAPMADPPILWDIESDPVLAGTKIFAEAWDAGGLYQVGVFEGDSWREWNGRFRDDVRSFFRGEDDAVKPFADRLIGSPQLFGHEDREAEQSLNFVTCHDGFTLNDLVSYDRKHNEANGGQNRDGTDDNRSWNCGVEGPTDDPEIERLRNRQVKNFFTVTLLSLGIPLILMGDEARRTQLGNNNAYCHDDETTWFDWTELERHADVHRFVRMLSARRLMRDAGAERRRVPLSQLLQDAQIAWHGVAVDLPDWSPHSHSIAMTASLEEPGVTLYLAMNAYWEPLRFVLPPAPSSAHGRWRRWIDTSRSSPEDIVDWTDAPPVTETVYSVDARAVVVLVASTS